MTPEEADAFLRGLTKYVDMYEDRRAEMPTTIDGAAVIAFSLSSQSMTANNDLSVVMMATRQAKEEQP